MSQRFKEDEKITRGSNLRSKLNDKEIVSQIEKFNCGVHMK